MDPKRMNRISKLFTRRPRSRRAAAQEATPAAASAPHVPDMLFVQTFQAGAITPVEGREGRYTLALEAGIGQTIYFSDRPDRVVGTRDTPEFLEVLGFPDDDPPNAALVIETEPGETDIAVIELFAPLYDPVTQGVTYEVEVLASWQTALEMGLSEAPTDLAALASSFGTAHLFIDGLYDCPDSELVCTRGDGTVVGRFTNGEHDGFCSTWGRGDGIHNAAHCLPCNPWVYSGDTSEVWRFWVGQCNRRFRECNGDCRPSPWCFPDPWVGIACPNF